MGISHNVGDKLTYIIYCEDTHWVISRSVICTAEPLNLAIINKWIDPDTALDDSLEKPLINDHNDPKCAKQIDPDKTPDASLDR